jgi:hypothetical protein
MDSIGDYWDDMPLKYLQHPGKLRMHWLGPYQIKYVIDGGVVQLKDLEGKEIQGRGMVFY